MMTEGLLVGLFLWSVSQGDWPEAGVLAVRWVWMFYQARARETQIA